MKKYILLTLISLMFSFKKKNEEEWTIFLKEKIENTYWVTGYDNEKIIFKNDTLTYYKNDSVKNFITYNLIGKPALGLMGYGKNFNIYFEKKIKRHSIDFYQDYKILTIAYNGINSFILINENKKSSIDSLILKGFIEEGVSNRMSIKQIDSLLSKKY